MAFFRIEPTNIVDAETVLVTAEWLRFESATYAVRLFGTEGGYTMKKFIMALSLGFLFAGCGDPAADAPMDDKKEDNASTSAATAVEDVADAGHEAHDEAAHADHGDEAVAAKTEEATGGGELVTVKFKVPGMK